eukprot:3148102-Prymnesium_polylepis.1
MGSMCVATQSCSRRKSRRPSSCASIPTASIAAAVLARAAHRGGVGAAAAEPPCGARALGVSPAK